MTHAQAYRKVRTALKQGVLVRPEHCQRCGSEGVKSSDGRSTIHAHHHDYNKPLDVEWICASCHMKETPRVKGEKNPQSRMTDALVKKAISRRNEGVSLRKIAKEIGVDNSTILRATNGTHWKHIAAAEWKSNAELKGGCLQPSDF